jgi:hypothetical protein
MTPERVASSPPPAWNRPALESRQQSGSIDGSAEVSAGVQRFQRAQARAADRTVEVLIAAGLSPEAALQVASRGMTAARATDLLSLELMQPSLDRFGPASAVLRILMEARALGAMSGPQVRARIAALSHCVVVRPDGYLAPALGGPAIQKTELPPGQLFHLSQGILRSLDDHLNPGSIISELSLEKGEGGAFLDGVEEAVMGIVFGVADSYFALRDHPAEALDALCHAVGSIPARIGRAIRRSPELVAALEAATPEDRTRFVSKLVASLALSLLGPRSVPEATIPPPLGALKIVDGPLVLSAANVDAVAGVVALAQVGVSVTISAASGAVFAEALDLRNTSRHDPTTIAEPEHRESMRRRIKDGLTDPTDQGASFDDILASIELAPAVGPGALEEYRALVLVRIRVEVERLMSLPADSRRRSAVEALRKFADEAGVDIHQALRSPAPPPPRATLSREAQRVLKEIDNGNLGPKVSSRRIAEEVLTQFPDYVDTKNWEMWQIKGLLAEKKRRTFHWDDEFDTNGRLKNHDDVHQEPHLQLHDGGDRTIRVWFRKGSRR